MCRQDFEHAIAAAANITGPDECCYAHGVDSETAKAPRGWQADGSRRSPAAPKFPTQTCGR
jgi:hypothetical protein